MKYVKVSKNQVIEAIKTESLRPENWIDSSWNWITDKNRVCHVCAVGAVFRSCLSESEDRFEDVSEFIDERVGRNYEGVLLPFASSYDSKEDCLKAAKQELKSFRTYLNTLSHLFESLCKMTGRNSQTISRHQIYRIKQTLIQFVEENFPKYIEVPVNGFDVKKGLKVFEK